MTWEPRAERDADLDRLVRKLSNIVDYLGGRPRIAQAVEDDVRLFHKLAVEARDERDRALGAWETEKSVTASHIRAYSELKSENAALRARLEAVEGALRELVEVDAVLKSTPADAREAVYRHRAARKSAVSALVDVDVESLRARLQTLETGLRETLTAWDDIGQPLGVWSDAIDAAVKRLRVLASPGEPASTEAGS